MRKMISAVLCAVIILTAAVCGGISAGAEENTLPEVPQIRIVTAEGNGITLQKDDGYVDAVVKIIDTDGSVTEGDVSFKVRGNGTAIPSILKKAYTFKFDKKRDVLGLGKGKKWALLANAMDVTLLRNYIAIDLAQHLGIRYTSEQRMVELWVDDSFRGLYLLIEPVQEGKERVNIDIESNNGMKDFLLELEATRVEEGISYIQTGGIRFAVSEPEEPNSNQMAYINSVMNAVINTLRTGTEEEIREVIDVDSFAKFYILNEYVKTVDFNYSSVFFYYQDGKLCAGPPWDYDHAMGSGSDASTGNYRNAAGTEDPYTESMHFYQYLCKFEWFMDEVRAIYADNREYIENIAEYGGLIDTLAETYSHQIDRNFTDAGWSITRQWSAYQRKPLPTYQENLDFLKDWCQSRYAWMDRYLTEHAEIGVLVGDTDGDGHVTILDATMIQRVLAQLPTEAFNEIAADMDGDGTVTVLDATAIQRFLADLPIAPPVVEPVVSTPSDSASDAPTE